LSTSFNAFLNFSWQEVIPDSSASRLLRMTANTISNGELGIEFDTRDYPVNPRSGLRYLASFAYGLKENSGPDYVIKEDSLSRREGIKKLRINLDYYIGLWKNQVLAFKMYGSYIQGDKNQLQLSDHIWFGGFGTVRGYREDQFHGTTVSWLNLEYRFIVGRNSRVFLFNDWGFFQYDDIVGLKKDIVGGFGIGIRFDSPLGIMGVDYGLGQGDTFSTGKIYFGIINTF
jgi:outer membrane protein insertion porin family